MTVRLSRGNVTSIFFKLCSRAPIISMKLFDLRRVLGTAISKVPFRYLAVNESYSNNSAKDPSATSSPPKDPASGPISMILSAAFMMSSSCSTTITVLPKSRKFFRTFIKRSVSFG